MPLVPSFLLDEDTLRHHSSDLNIENRSQFRFIAIFQYSKPHLDLDCIEGLQQQMFSWCKTCETEPLGSGYLVRKDQEPAKFYPKFADIKEADLQHQNTSVLRINRSEYEAFSKSLTATDRKFVDQDFPPDDKSLGKFEEVRTDKWKRIAEISPAASFFGKTLTPSEAAAGNHNRTVGYRAAVAAIAERPERVTQLFGNAVVSPNGIYTFLLRHKGKIEEVIIDDYLPVGEAGDPLFSKSTEALWPVLLEKARAKLHGSYEAAVSQSLGVRAALQEITFAPTEVIKNANVGKDELWGKLQSASKGTILVARSGQSQKINWASIGLTPNHFYTVLDAATLPHKLGSSFRVVKLRNAFAHEDYKGEGSLTDSLFWEQIEPCEERARLLSSDSPKDGLIFLLFSDYIKYFEETVVNYYEPVRNYFHQTCDFTIPNGLVFDLTILKEGQYSLVLDQNNMQPQKKGLDYVEDGWSRATILLMRDHSPKASPMYEYLGGVLKYNEQYAHLRMKLQPGKYIVYAKLEATLTHSNFPSCAELVLFSTQATQIKPTSQQHYPNLLKTVFLAHARANKRQQYNNELMWSSWRLIAQGGYAYIALGNSSESKNKFVISFKEQVFNQLNFTLKKPFKGKGDQTIEVLPGNEEIILLRIKNSQVLDITFPPPIDLQIVPV